MVPLLLSVPFVVPVEAKAVPEETLIVPVTVQSPMLQRTGLVILPVTVGEHTGPASAAVAEKTAAKATASVVCLGKKVQRAIIFKVRFFIRGSGVERAVTLNLIHTTSSRSVANAFRIWLQTWWHTEFIKQ